jgi:hypothetical protein
MKLQQWHSCNSSIKVVGVFLYLKLHLSVAKWKGGLGSLRHLAEDGGAGVEPLVGGAVH